MYVDDLFLIGIEKLITRWKSNMPVEFKMKNIGMMLYFLGLEVWQRPTEIFLEQGKYAIQILKVFWMENWKPMATPMITNLKKVTTSDSELVDPIDQQVVYILTKPLEKGKFEVFKDKLGLVQIPSSLRSVEICSLGKNFHTCSV